MIPGNSKGNFAFRIYRLKDNNSYNYRFYSPDEDPDSNLDDLLDDELSGKFKDSNIFTFMGVDSSFQYHLKKLREYLNAGDLTEEEVKLYLGNKLFLH